MYQLVVIVHVLISIAIVVLVLLQQGKGADMGAAFGAGASGTLFGARGSASFLSRTTAILAVIFFLTSLSLAYFADFRDNKKNFVEVLKSAEPVSDAPVVTPTEAKQPEENKK